MSRLDPMESFRRSCRPVVGASHTIVSDTQFASSLEVHHQRWAQANPITGVPLYLAREAEALAAYNATHRGSRRVGPPRRLSLWQRLRRYLCSR